MSIITAFFASKIAVGLAAASLVTVGGTVAVTTAIASPPAAESTAAATADSSTETGSPAERTSPQAKAESTTDSPTSDSVSNNQSTARGSEANRYGSDASALALCEAFVNGGLSVDSVGYASLESIATVSSNATLNANGTVDPSAYCDTIVEVTDAAQERVSSAIPSETTTEVKLDITTGR
jgi:hypothetical protein